MVTLGNVVFAWTSGTFSSMYQGSIFYILITLWHWLRIVTNQMKVIVVGKCDHILQCYWKCSNKHISNGVVHFPSRSRVEPCNGRYGTLLCSSIRSWNTFYFIFTNLSMFKMLASWRTRSWTCGQEADSSVLIEQVWKSWQVNMSTFVKPIPRQRSWMNGTWKHFLKIQCEI